MIKVFSSIRSTYRAVSVAIDGENISNDMRRSIELVRTCNHDLQELVRLRNEHLHLLEKQAQSLERLNVNIEKAHKGLVDASRIVERYRLEVQSGKKSLQTQIAWAHRDSQEFQALGPTMSQHNATILAEISFLRSLTFITTQREPKKAKENVGLEDGTLFDNAELLEDYMGDISASRDLPLAPPRPPPSPSTIRVSESASMPSLFTKQVYCDLPEPVVPNTIPHQQAIVSSLTFEHAPSLQLLSGQTLEQGAHRNSPVVLNETDHSGLTLLFGNELVPSFDASSNIQPQGWIRDSMHKLSVPSLSRPSQNDQALISTPSTHFTLISRPSSLSVSSIGTFNQQSPDNSLDLSHILSLQPTLPTNKSPFTSLAITSSTSDTQKDTLPRPREIALAEQYGNASDHSGHENRHQRPWRPDTNGHVYELQGSEISQELPSFAQYTASLSNRSNTQ
ncbi:hypothetical protein V8C42DRAFT_336044 [Trichoderma barbatum]